jgi:nitrate reductase gamma subunit
MKINADFLWYFHVVPSLVFFIYLPHSKLLHIFTSSMTVVSDRQKQLRKHRDSEIEDPELDSGHGSE